MSLKSRALAALIGAAPFIVYLVLSAYLSSSKPEPPPPLITPAEVRVEVGKIIQISAEGVATPVHWHLCDEDPSVDTFSLDDGRTIGLVATKPGKYRLKAIGLYKKSFVFSTTVVIVGKPTPPPNPGPSPPDDPFFAILKAAYAKDTSVNKKEQLDQLAAFYKQAGTLTVNTQSVTTVGELYSVLREAISSLLALDNLVGVRDSIATELKTKLPTASSTPLDPALRKQCADQFLRLSSLLSSVAT